jgi:hypothetical protein
MSPTEEKQKEGNEAADEEVEECGDNVDYAAKIKELDKVIQAAFIDFNAQEATEEKKEEYFRKRNALYSQRKYYRRKLKITALLREQKSLELKNSEVKVENKLLETVLAWATEQVHMHESRASASPIGIIQHGTTSNSLLLKSNALLGQPVAQQANIHQLNNNTYQPDAKLPAFLHFPSQAGLPAPHNAGQGRNMQNMAETLFPSVCQANGASQPDVSTTMFQFERLAAAMPNATMPPQASGAQAPDMIALVSLLLGNTVLPNHSTPSFASQGGQGLENLVLQLLMSFGAATNNTGTHQMTLNHPNNNGAHLATINHPNNTGAHQGALNHPNSTGAHQVTVNPGIPNSGDFNILGALGLTNLQEALNTPLGQLLLQTQKRKSPYAAPPSFPQEAQSVRPAEESNKRQRGVPDNSALTNMLIALNGLQKNQLAPPPDVDTCQQSSGLPQQSTLPSPPVQQCPILQDFRSANSQPAPQFHLASPPNEQPPTEESLQASIQALLRKFT